MADRRIMWCVQWPGPQDSEQDMVALVAERACDVSKFRACPVWGQAEV